jgi:hypothetical protein
LTAKRYCRLSGIQDEVTPTPFETERSLEEQIAVLEELRALKESHAQLQEEAEALRAARTTTVDNFLIVQELRRNEAMLRDKLNIEQAAHLASLKQIERLETGYNELIDWAKSGNVNNTPANLSDLIGARATTPSLREMLSPAANNTQRSPEPTGAAQASVDPSHASRGSLSGIVGKPNAPKVSEFTGSSKQNVETWLDTLEKYMSFTSVDKESWVMYAYFKILDEIKSIWNSALADLLAKMARNTNLSGPNSVKYSPICMDPKIPLPRHWHFSTR